MTINLFSTFLLSLFVCFSLSFFLSHLYKNMHSHANKHSDFVKMFIRQVFEPLTFSFSSCSVISWRCSAFFRVLTVPLAFDFFTSEIFVLGLSLSFVLVFRPFPLSRAIRRHRVNCRWLLDIC